MPAPPMEHKALLHETLVDMETKIAAVKSEIATLKELVHKRWVHACIHT